MRFRDGNLGDGWAEKTLNRQAVNVWPVNQISEPAVTQSDSINAVRGGRQGDNFSVSVGLHQSYIRSRCDVVTLVNDDGAERGQVPAGLNHENRNVRTVIADLMRQLGPMRHPRHGAGNARNKPVERERRLSRSGWANDGNPVVSFKGEDRGVCEALLVLAEIHVPNR